jgi:hypothetical protein
VLEDCDVIVMLVAGNGLGPIRAACIECAEGADRVAEAASRRYVFGDGLLASLVLLILSFSCFSLICSYLFLGNEFDESTRVCIASSVSRVYNVQSISLDKPASKVATSRARASRFPQMVPLISARSR